MCGVDGRSTKRRGSLLLDEYFPKTEKFQIFGRSIPTTIYRLRWKFEWPSGLTCRSAVPMANFTWIGAKSHPCCSKMMIFGLVNEIPAVCRFAASYGKNIQNEKKRSKRHKHCALAIVRRSQKISPCRRPLPVGAGRPKFNQLEMVTTFT